MGLIEALLANPFLLILIIGGLLSLFRNAGANNQEQQKRSEGPATRRNTQGQEEIDWREIFRQEQSPPDNPPTETRNTGSRQAVEEKYTPVNRDTEIVNANRELQERYEKMQERKKLAAESSKQFQDSPIFSKEITDSKVHLNFKNISREEAIKGIIWSEVLGKPKAKQMR